ncbi:Dihydroneopterin triphosphate diphosphatase [Saliniradius amylolyticus]|uniref:Dihydroneopterin triphosphate diphosphatase n=1 Tax=Saliniradius amylolyticus TaxID=2183582 RepID=A0A2S2E3U7_9ALTE|nr:dihydroneopterin triphosphate diphosphatase [Saliniradius amylolyticus]AWL12328.1 Dihydroneopterin triphosphate diphosphatase [Saliniradius amylolyticus]
MTLKRPESVLVVIYDRQYRVLLLRRLDDPEFWQSVTGSLESEETPWQTAYREVLEETGIDIEALGHRLEDHQQKNQYPIRPEWRYRYPEGVSENTEYVYSLQVDSGQPITLSEHSEFRWLSINEAAEMAWSPSNAEAILSLTQRRHSFLKGGHDGRAQ